MQERHEALTSLRKSPEPSSSVRSGPCDWSYGPTSPSYGPTASSPELPVDSPVSGRTIVVEFPSLSPELSEDSPLPASSSRTITIHISESSSPSNTSSPIPQELSGTTITCPASPTPVVASSPAPSSPINTRVLRKRKNTDL